MCGPGATALVVPAAPAVSTRLAGRPEEGGGDGGVPLRLLFRGCGCEHSKTGTEEGPRGARCSHLWGARHPPRAQPAGGAAVTALAPGPPGPPPRSGGAPCWLALVPEGVWGGSRVVWTRVCHCGATRGPCSGLLVDPGGRAAGVPGPARALEWTSPRPRFPRRPVQLPAEDPSLPEGDGAPAQPLPYFVLRRELVVCLSFLPRCPTPPRVSQALLPVFFLSHTCLLWSRVSWFQHGVYLLLTESRCLWQCDRGVGASCPVLCVCTSSGSARKHILPLGPLSKSDKRPL